MRHFLYDEVNKRLVLVDGLWPSIELEKADRFVTPNSNQARIYNSLYVWENVKIVTPNDFYLPSEREPTYYEVWSLDGEGKKREKRIMELPPSDTIMIYGGAYQYNLPKPA